MCVCVCVCVQIVSGGDHCMPGQKDGTEEVSL